MKKILFYLILTALIINIPPARAESGKYEKFLDKVEKEAFSYFWYETDPETGFTSNTSEPGSPATNAAAGFMLTGLIIGIERGWISKEDGYNRALTALKSFQKIENFQGFTYHYFNKKTGKRMWNSEVSCIDMGLFLAGVITIGEYFKGTEAEGLADKLFRRTNWQWFLDGESALQMAWTPERGFSARIGTFSEGIICYILAMGSPTYPISGDYWNAFARPVSKYKGYELIYAVDGSLFQYLFPLAWLDLGNTHDKYADYLQNAIKAVKANKQYCMDNADNYKTYKKGFWGLSASLSPEGYKVYGAKPGVNAHDGTVAPYAVGGSIPLTPEFSIADYKSMYEKNPKAVGKYGLTDAFNLDRKWAAKHYISIDKGLTLLMIENYRTGLVWKYFMRSKYVENGLKKAGFEPGSLSAPSELVYLAGNPRDTVTVKKRSAEIKIDGDISEWGNSPQLILTGEDNRNAELDIGYVKDNKDLSGVFYLTWDDKNLYIAGVVNDNETVCREIKSNIFLDDCVEIFFDTNKDGYCFNGNPYDYQLGVAPGGPKETSQIWAWGYRNKMPANIEYAARSCEDMYVLEIAIPFDEINGFDPDEKEPIGFSISINDRDKDNKAKKLTWSIDKTSQPGKTFFGTLAFSQ